VAIKLETEKTQLAKWALCEITLLRHFASHENITGLIDMNAIISPDYQEICLPFTVYVRAMFTWWQIHIRGLVSGYAFSLDCSGPSASDMKSEQTLTNEHVQYFLYQSFEVPLFLIAYHGNCSHSSAQG